MVSLEILVRAAGLTNFPLYDREPGVDYIARANQAGRFLGRNRWAFNDRHLGVDGAWRAGAHPNVLLVGNSIVMGGNPFDQPEKLGPQLERRLEGLTVWPAATGGWSTVNEMAFLDDNRDVEASADAVIWEVMPGQFARANPWQGELTFPTRRPVCAFCYVAMRYGVARFWPALAGRETAAPGPRSAAQAARFLAWAEEIARTQHKPLTILLYPTLADWRAAREGRPPADEAFVRQVASQSGARLIDLMRDPRWSEVYYRSDETHPTPAGVTALAQILAASAALPTPAQLPVRRIAAAVDARPA
jgi:hypothetical protein